MDPSHYLHDQVESEGPVTGPLLTPEQVAEICNVAPDTVLRWRLRGAGPKFLKVNPRCFRYRREDVNEWLESIIEEPREADKPEEPTPPLLEMMKPE